MKSENAFIHPSDPAGKALILREALRLFAKEGLSATSIRDIASATGLSNPALYKHFGSKEELALTLFERLYEAHYQQLSTALNTAPGFDAKFRAFLSSRLEAFDQHPDATFFATNHIAVLWPKVSERLKKRTILSLQREMIETGRSEGLVRRDINSDLLIAIVSGALEQVTRQVHFQVLPGPAVAHLEALEHVLRAGIR